MCPNKSWFHNYKEKEPKKVYVRDNNSHSVFRIGDIAIMMYDGIVKQIKNVRHVSNLKKKNLILLGILEYEGHTLKFENNISKIMKEFLVVMKGPKKNGLLLLYGRSYQFSRF